MLGGEGERGREGCEVFLFLEGVGNESDAWSGEETKLDDGVEEMNSLCLYAIHIHMGRQYHTWLLLVGLNV